jgi:hypothetical protein
MLNKYYFINVAPVLLREILGDLKKSQEGNRTPEQKVRALSRKLSRCNLHYIVYHMSLMEANLLGNEVKMDGRPIEKATMTIEENGSKGMVIAETPDEKALSRWKDGNFNQTDYELSEQYRQFAKSIDLESIKNLREVLPPMPDFKELGDIVLFIDKTHTVELIQKELLKGLILDFEFDSPIAQRIFLRWEQENHKSVKSFAPYAYFCFRLNLIFDFGLAGNLIPTRPTNEIDLQYLYYLPFCDIFVSLDKFHKLVAPNFLAPYQTFIEGKDLKNDLATLVAEWESTFKKDIDKWQEKYGKEPPQNEKSVTYNLWKKYFLDRKAGVDGMTERLDAPDVSFIKREYYISPEGPCPCGSGKPLKECCLKKIGKNNPNKVGDT